MRALQSETSFVLSVALKLLRISTYVMHVFITSKTKATSTLFTVLAAFKNLTTNANTRNYTTSKMEVFMLWQNKDRCFLSKIQF